MEELLIQGQSSKSSVWDNYVPIIKSGRHTDIYLTDSIEAPNEYNELCHVLRTAYKEDTVTLYINNGGGYVDSGFMIINAIKESQAKVTAKLSGTVASVSTIIALSCDEVEIDNYIQFMIHNYSGGAQGKGHEMKAQMEFTDAQLNKAFTEIYGGFLTEHEMELVIAGKDIWMGKEELSNRLTARKKKDVKSLEEIAKIRKGK